MKDPRKELIDDVQRDAVLVDMFHNQNKKKGNPLQRFIGRIATNTKAPIAYDLMNYNNGAENDEPLQESINPKDVILNTLLSIAGKENPKGKWKNINPAENELITIDDDDNPLSMKDQWEWNPNTWARARDYLYRGMFNLPTRKFSEEIYEPLDESGKRVKFNKNSNEGKFLNTMMGFNHKDWINAKMRGESEGNMDDPVLGGFNFEIDDFGYDPDKKKHYVNSKFKDRWDFDLNPGESISGSPGNYPSGSKNANIIRFLLSKITDPITVEGEVRTDIEGMTDEQISKLRQLYKKKKKSPQQRGVNIGGGNIFTNYD